MGYSGNMYAQFTEVITSQGDLRRGDSSGNPERLAIGSTGKFLKSNGTTESWETITTADSTLTTQGDILYENASGLARLGQSTDGFVLTTKGASANPVWASAAGGGGAETASFIGTTGSFSTDSTSFVDVTNVTLTLPTTTAASDDCLFGFNGGCEVGTVGNNIVFALVQDTTEVTIFKAEPISLGYMFDISGNVIVNANGETGKLQMKMSGGAASNLVMSGSQYAMLTAFAS